MNSIIDLESATIKDANGLESKKHNKKQVPERLRKYYSSRYRIFNKFDEGIKLNEELWYSVTPEKPALFLSKLIKWYFPENKTILDVFSGGGGNAIQFAKEFDQVIGIDVNIENIRCAIVNSEVYDVNKNITYLNIDWLALCKNEENLKILKRTYDIDILFSSPPWGGPEYLMEDIYDLNKLEPLGFKELLISFFKVTKNVVIFLPRNSDLKQISQVTRELLGKDAITKVLMAYDSHKLIGIFCFFGDIFTQEFSGD